MRGVEPARLGRHHLRKRDGLAVGRPGKPRGRAPRWQDEFEGPGAAGEPAGWRATQLDQPDVLGRQILPEEKVLVADLEGGEKLLLALALGRLVRGGEGDRGAIGPPAEVLDTCWMRGQPPGFSPAHRQQPDLHPALRVGREETERLAIGGKVGAGDHLALEGELPAGAAGHVHGVELGIVAVGSVIGPGDRDDRGPPIGGQLDAPHAHNAAHAFQGEGLLRGERRRDKDARGDGDEGEQAKRGHGCRLNEEGTGSP